MRPAMEGVGLLIWGDPLLESRLVAVRGEAVTEEELQTLGWARGEQPLGYRRPHQPAFRRAAFEEML